MTTQTMVTANQMDQVNTEFLKAIQIINSLEAIKSGPRLENGAVGEAKTDNTVLKKRNFEDMSGKRYV